MESLTSLSKDPAVLHVMQKHRFSVGLLTELAPHEHPGLLGLNVGSGGTIKLRIRLDTYDGFRPYLEVRRVLCHELAHNVWSEHNDDVSCTPSCLFYFVFVIIMFYVVQGAELAA